MKISQVPSLRSWSLFINCFVKQWWERQLIQRAEPIWRVRRPHPCNQTPVPQDSQGHSHCSVTLGCCVTSSPCLSLFHYNRKTTAALLSAWETQRADVCEGEWYTHDGQQSLQKSEVSEWPLKVPPSSKILWGFYFVVEINIESKRIFNLKIFKPSNWAQLFMNSLLFHE